MNSFLEIHPEVKQALANNKPVVALESTIISHGMPYPKNMETALHVEQIVRNNRAIPATIAIINGKLKAGLTKTEIELLAKQGPSVIKTSRRDIPYLVSKNLTGATTVASTMIIAQMAGIKIFATGGIGGVHRGAAESFDISADLQELAHTNVAVVCAGAKAILDLNLTLEYLETQGVPVIGYKTKELPAFYTRKSGLNVDFKLDSAQEIATFLKSKWDLNLNGGVVIANPVPSEYQMDYSLIMSIIDNALLEADKLGVKGKESTPFLLEKITDLTQGQSLETNIQLVLNNAKLASKIACNYVKLINH
ncbi:pseudouridine-5-phosphate glycosidase [Lutibacter profundi]|uniref:Pseudouridine-5'-phosphate glycosidase n=1 Tax=Lutibacter profundi TaxID=1622118 RepID=A0A109RNM6_9FLAO|nr:pseudouridine-5'-phosphate glycosidase [Lutibacter profundi]AMC11215.1 pseudouridine-5-phosphate glycosidase [Lutibacter profundi]